ncbi:hypothetical protein P9222_11155 [Paenibacillus amylolyticus]|nr:hypothetical protein [Paenibacillus amylolyticus]WFR64619.1 hypothetical protein P9222_11155 [Paenibacillus amylolyticus]
MENRSMDKGVIRYKRSHAANEEMMERAIEGVRHADDTAYVDTMDLDNGGSRDGRDSKVYRDSRYDREGTYNRGDTYKKDETYYLDDTYDSTNGAMQTEGAGSSSRSLRNEYYSRSGWTGAVGILSIVLLLAGCLRRGLYYSTDLYPVLLVATGSTLIMIVLFLAIFHSGKEKGQGQGRKQVPLSQVYWPGNHERMVGRMIYIPGMWRVLWPLGMMTCFGLHAWAGSVSKQGSMDEMLRWSMLALFALLTAILAARTDGARWFVCGWQMAGGLLVLSGILAVCGVLPLPFGVMRTADPEISSAGARLGGLLQYPNAYGAIIGMYAVERLTAAARAHSPACVGRATHRGSAAAHARASCAPAERVARRLAGDRLRRGRRLCFAAARCPPAAAAGHGRATSVRGLAVPPAGCCPAGACTRARPAGTGRGMGSCTARHAAAVPPMAQRRRQGSARRCPNGHRAGGGRRRTDGRGLHRRSPGGGCRHGDIPPTDVAGCPPAVERGRMAWPRGRHMAQHVSRHSILALCRRRGPQRRARSRPGHGRDWHPACRRVVSPHPAKHA